MSSPAWSWLGLRALEADAGRAVVEMDCTDDMRNHRGTVHGGFISALADSAMGRAMRSLMPDEGRHASFDLKLSFISPAQAGERLRAEGKVVHAGRRTGVCECRVEGPGGRLVATASATFFLQRGTDAD
ncbi:MAG TPA: PaaI family thioesterase [Candidatus Acidoferrales bacterium]|nr:PaaI family thioesterase [Candidatus Acidoferrales bacterium]